LERPILTQEVQKFSTWYEATAARNLVRPPLDKNVSVDVCVIGGGLAGLTTALELVRAGKSVALLESKRIAHGASGRNGGFVSNGFAEGIETVAKRVGLEAAQKLYNLSREGTEYVRAEIANSDPTLKMGQGWLVALRHRDDGGLRAHAETMTHVYNEPTQFNPVAETRAHLKSERYFESVSGNLAFHFHPLRYALMLLAKLEVLGTQAFEECPALSVEKNGAAIRVKTARGFVNCQHVVHCVSSLDRNIHPLTGRAVLPVATYVAVTEPLNQDAIVTGSAISDTRRAGDYYRVISEGRILWGGRITTRVQEPAMLAAKMRGDMLSVFPQLGQPKMDYAWAGLMAYALHKMPLIGRDNSGQWFATAFGGHGMNTTAMAGKVLARAICGVDDDYRRFTPYAPQWAFGQLGRLGVQGAYWLMQAKDRIEEAKSRH
jgi:gamma-glutamylputrescine oxidase